ncbi:hypothetical protein NQ318_006522 [Aromia moschata]|uniref:Uncharacterized protein n=1 Tax=Aromia moschata TaxID=1265417 RepID=A0AAV8YNM1_9CUCU|nr:hypothetical protein NQ318_006522 [Aromia moschata]
MATRRDVLKASMDPLPSSTDPLRELFEACKVGDIARVRKLITPTTVNARDTAGRKSTLYILLLVMVEEALLSFFYLPVPPFKPVATAACILYTRVFLRTPQGRTLLQHGADINIRNTEAARSGAEDRLLALLNPLNVNCHASDGRRSTPLHLAAGYNRNRVVQLLLQHGADVHAKDKGGLVPLHNACSYGHFEVTEMLIKHGANVNANDLWAFTPLQAASRVRSLFAPAQRGRSPPAKLPFEIRYRHEYKGHLLLEAVRQADTAKLKKYLTPEIINFKHPYSGDTALHAAVNSLYPKRKQVLETLIRKGGPLK